MSLSIKDEKNQLLYILGKYINIPDVTKNGEPEYKDNIVKKNYKEVSDTINDFVKRVMKPINAPDFKDISETLIDKLIKYDADSKIDLNVEDLKKIQELKQSIEKKVEEIGEYMIRCAPQLESNITFNDLAGMEKEKKLMINTYIYPAIYPGLFGKSGPKNLLLGGSPGTGKTLLVQASTKELPDYYFVAPKPADLKGRLEGDTEKFIQIQFECAKAALNRDSRKKGAIIFFDEFDAVASKRNEEDPSTTRTVNTLLQNIGGVDSDPRVSIIAATNFPQNIDEAVLRRFTDKIYVDLPDKEAIEYIVKSKIVKFYLQTKNVTLENVNEKLNETLELIKMYGGTLTLRDISEIINTLFTTKKSNYTRYSASDIDKIIEISIRSAAAYILSQYTTDLESNRLLIVKDNSYIAVPDGFKINSSSDKKDKVVQGIAFANIKTSSEKAKIMSYYITKGCFNKEIKSYRPTITQKSYDEVKKFFEEE